jgi:SAM-dependent methyltransferase
MHGTRESRTRPTSGDGVGSWLAPLSNGSASAPVSIGLMSGAVRESFQTVDRSHEYVEFARKRVVSERIQFAPGNAEALPVEDGAFDATVSGLMLNFVPVPEVGLAEMSRVTRSGGVVATYLWDYAEGMQMLRYFWDSAGEQFDDANTLDEAARFPICDPGALAQLFADARLTDVQVTGIDMPTPFDNFEDYWAPFTGGQGPAPAFLKSLPEADQVQLRESIREAIPVEQDGSINLVARAWAVRGTKP